ncbi:MAG: DUF1579 domain-containing protein [Planctomycetia bacterium]|nr:DUF1579 domain-containing protein [Planctomycetia bacterium]
MKPLPCLASLLLFLASAPFATSFDDKNVQKQAEKAQEREPPFGQPTEDHKRLEPLVGKWDLACKFYEGDQATESKGSASFRFVLGKRFLIEESKTTAGGQAFEWIGTHGYDTGKKKYVSSWIDNGGTGIDVMEGTWDDATKKLTYTGELDEPEANAKYKVRWAIEIAGQDKFNVEMYLIDGGKDVKVLSIAGTRAKE